MRLNIRVYSGQAAHQCSKYLTYLSEEIKTIKQVEDHLKDVLDIKGELILRLGEYLLPKRQSIKVLTECNIVDCYVNNPISIKNLSKTTQIKKSQDEQQDSEDSSSIQIRVQKSAKHLPKIPTRKSKLPRPSDGQDSKDSSSESENQSNESFQIKKQMKSRVIVDLPLKQKPFTFQSNTSKKAITDEKLITRANQLGVVSNPSKLSKTIEMRNQTLPTIIKPIKTRQQSLQDSLSKQHSRFKLVDLSKQKQFLSKGKEKVPQNQLKPYPVKRQVTKSVAVQEIKQQFASEWTEVPMKNIQSYLQTKGTGFLQPGDQIQYKITEFDEEKYIPVLSNWIPAKVQDVDGKGGLTLFEMGKLKKISEINLFGLKLKTTQLKAREHFLNTSPNVIITQKQTQYNQSPTCQNQKPSVCQQKPKESSKIDRLIEQFNYYFSDTNYFSDNYLKAHASKNKDSYISLKCFMNFNKLKPLVANEGELETAIRSSDLSNCNFEIHPQDKMIRKKGLTNL